MNTKYILLILLPIFLAGCKKDKINEDKLWADGGLWKIIKYEYRTTGGWPEKSEKCNNCGYLKFNKNGKVNISIEDHYSYTSTYAVTKSGKLILDYDEDGGEEYKIMHKGGILTLTFDEYYPDEGREFERFTLKKQ